MGEIAHQSVDTGDASATIDHAFGNIAAWINPQAQEHRRTARPIVEQVAGEVVSLEHWCRKMRRLRDAASTARPVAPGAAACSIAAAASATSRTPDVRCALRRREPLPRRFARGHFLDPRDFNPRLRRHDRSRLTSDVLRGRAALLFPGSGLLGRGRRGRRLGEVDEAEPGLGIVEVDRAGDVEEGEQQGGLNYSGRDQRTAAIAIGNVSAIGHARSTPTTRVALLNVPQQENAGACIAKPAFSFTPST